ncbi:MAG: hypothetical protein CMP21_02450 [Rickettsiales bacterium]|nr:hypothetical protein [Rickettsiales bacterium]|tara:strand:+ start:34669 stop:35658 length:990 start_codon:yes stop_codon:yes gene_type:complete
MKRKRILYGINGTGVGHISRAKSLIPYLKRYVDVDILISGKLQELNFDDDVLYDFTGFTFVYEGGAVNWLKTIFQSHPLQFIRDIFSMNLKPYDMVITDFEPISAWGSFFRFKHCINVSHQSSFYSFKTPRTPLWPFFIFAELFMRFYSFTFDYLGVHFLRYNDNIFPPVLKDEIIDAKPTQEGHITVYLSAFSLQEQIDFFKQFPDYDFQIFHKHCNEVAVVDNLKISPLSETFKYSMIASSGYISNAGFESNAEALHLKKPLLCIPIRFQYEQYCNGAALKKLGVTVIPYLKKRAVNDWLLSRQQLPPIHICDTDEFAKAIVKKIKN